MFPIRCNNDDTLAFGGVNNVAPIDDRKIVYV